MIIVALLLGAGLALELCILLRAPVGYQDETGFHLGAEKR